MSVAPRLFVLTATESPMAVILRRGPSGQVASLGWDRDSDEITVGQWLKGRIHEFRADLSPDGRQMVYFAGKGDPAHPTGGWWTAVSRAPWLHALHLFPQGDTWHGGGAFTARGDCWLNGQRAPDGVGGEVRFCVDPGAFPHSTDGFFMGDLHAARMALRGWRAEGTGYDVVLRKPIGKGESLVWRVRTGQKNRALVAGGYAVETDGQEREMPEWDWADTWTGGLRVAAGGRLLAMTRADGDWRAAREIHEFRAMQFERLRAPYDSGGVTS